MFKLTFALCFQSVFIHWKYTNHGLFLKQCRSRKKILWKWTLCEHILDCKSFLTHHSFLTRKLSNTCYAAFKNSRRDCWKPASQGYSDAQSMTFFIRLERSFNDLHSCTAIKLLMLIIWPKWPIASIWLLGAKFVAIQIWRCAHTFATSLKFYAFNARGTPV